jgi:hypothetical protein
VIAVLIVVALLIIEFLGRGARTAGADAGASAGTRDG